jgi:hypothetical protein
VICGWHAFVPKIGVRAVVVRFALKLSGAKGQCSLRVHTSHALKRDLCLGAYRRPVRGGVGR